MKLEFEGKTALITGGGSGIGQASALALAARGCVATVAGRTTASLEETISQIEAAGGMARFAECDVTDEHSVQAAVEAAVDGFDRLDFSVNCAGISGT